MQNKHQQADIPDVLTERHAGTFRTGLFLAALPPTKARYLEMGSDTK